VASCARFLTPSHLQFWLTSVAITTLFLPATAAMGQSEKARQPAIRNTAAYEYKMPGVKEPIKGISNKEVLRQLLTDPLGQVTGCGGELLPDYTGFSVGLYQPDPRTPGGPDIKGPEPLTRTELPDNPSNQIPAGREPNTTNVNPYFLSTAKEGKYSFLLDPGRGQLAPGKIYILMVNPPSGSEYAQRRIRLTIGQRSGRVVRYRATSLDGKPISLTTGETTINGYIVVEDADQIGLELNALQLATDVCQAAEIQITKTGDRVTAAPGDTVVYRLNVENLTPTPIRDLVITDILPIGFRLMPDSVRAKLGETVVPVKASTTGRTVTFTFGKLVLPARAANKSLKVAYAAVLTPDALRGDGENRAFSTGDRNDNNQPVQDGPAIFRVRVEGGILSDAGTILGRVFVDKNFDGEQQNGEPGVPNAVVFLEDGTRITTDPNGLFSVPNVRPGYHTGVLDLSSVKGYTLAPNLYVKERNSQSRLVRLEPGGMARMNFAVTPIAEGEQPK
jgi:uncharacterized repeat protein (TIGR01451 family)